MTALPHPDGRLPTHHQHIHPASPSECHIHPQQPDDEHHGQAYPQQQPARTEGLHLRGCIAHATHQEEAGVCSLGQQSFGYPHIHFTLQHRPHRKLSHLSLAPTQRNAHYAVGLEEEIRLSSDISSCTIAHRNYSENEDLHFPSHNRLTTTAVTPKIFTQTFTLFVHFIGGSSSSLSSVLYSCCIYDCGTSMGKSIKRSCKKTSDGLFFIGIYLYLCGECKIKQANNIH